MPRAVKRTRVSRHARWRVHVLCCKSRSTGCAPEQRRVEFITINKGVRVRFNLTRTPLHYPWKS